MEYRFLFHNFLVLSVKLVVLAKFLKNSKNKKDASKLENDEKSKYYCSVCGREISEEEYESYDGMCWECWDDQMLKSRMACLEM
jgi:CRISPR/Cas system-associated protein Cas10 (large subunit of type III CRISPR-Cas system)